ncbi:MAG: hypothetical protein IT259_07410 [Saprospiraceae bacterium]|nr:hypothetical protein [Saprospiraceae bacterium]
MAAKFSFTRRCKPFSRSSADQNDTRQFSARQPGQGCCQKPARRRTQRFCSGIPRKIGQGSGWFRTDDNQ